MVPSLLPPEDSSRYAQSLVQRSVGTMWYGKKAVDQHNIAGLVHVVDLHGAHQLIPPCRLAWLQKVHCGCQ